MSLRGAREVVSSPWNERRSGWKPKPDDARSAGEIDYSRIIHAESFRRLQGKTQVFSLGDNDFYRSRLNHSLEVAQIASSLVQELKQRSPELPWRAHLPGSSLIRVAGAAHDLGHPPFGHGGEVALNYCMRKYGGFEGNGQTLRIVSRLEKFSEAHGADFTRRSLLALLKYPISYSAANNPAIAPKLSPQATTVQVIDRAASKPPKCYFDSEKEVVDWVLSPFSEADQRLLVAVERRAGEHGRAEHKSFDCSIMDLADDIAYGVHDLEDSLALGLLSARDFERFVPEERCEHFLSFMRARYPKEGITYARLSLALFGETSPRKHWVSRLVNYFIKQIRVIERTEFEHPLLRYRLELAEGPASFLKALHDLLWEVVISSPNIQQLGFKGQRLVVAVFEALASDPQAFLPRDIAAQYKRSPEPERVICDHIAGMTDAFLMRTYERLFAPHIGSVYERL